ncbi:MAG TPA: ABC transporter permease [Bryobacteraceae bacterium]|nr:ABC transporter permease [Bryobacteraceae bacterium]
MRTALRRFALVVLALVALAALFAPQIAPRDYSLQFREAPRAPAGGPFLMGTDDLGRDRFSRLLYATRISILLAPAAALVSVLLALPLARFTSLTTLCLSLPWIFLFIILRALLPLNASPWESILLTFGLMGVAGWAWPARVFAASLREIRQSGWLLQARAAGLSDWRISLVYVWPHLRAIAIAQFRALIPAYILSEASLGLLGLGVAEPLPSWGNLLAELQRPDAVRSNPWVLAPLALLMLVMICLEIVQPVREGVA